MPADPNTKLLEQIRDVLARLLSRDMDRGQTGQPGQSRQAGQAGSSAGQPFGPMPGRKWPEKTPGQGLPTPEQKQKEEASKGQEQGVLGGLKKPPTVGSALSNLGTAAGGFGEIGALLRQASAVGTAIGELGKAVFGPSKTKLPEVKTPEGTTRGSLLPYQHDRTTPLPKALTPAGEVLKPVPQVHAGGTWSPTGANQRPPTVPKLPPPLKPPVLSELGATPPLVPKLPPPLKPPVFSELGAQTRPSVPARLPPPLPVPGKTLFSDEEVEAVRPKPAPTKKWQAWKDESQANLRARFGGESPAALPDLKTVPRPGTQPPVRKLAGLSPTSPVAQPATRPLPHSGAPFTPMPELTNEYPSGHVPTLPMPPPLTPFQAAYPGQKPQATAPLTQLAPKVTLPGTTGPTNVTDPNVPRPAREKALRGAGLGPEGSGLLGRSLPEPVVSKLPRSGLAGLTGGEGGGRGEAVGGMGGALEKLADVLRENIRITGELKAALEKNTEAQPDAVEHGENDKSQSIWTQGIAPKERKPDDSYHGLGDGKRPKGEAESGGSLSEIGSAIIKGSILRSLGLEG